MPVAEFVDHIFYLDDVFGKAAGSLNEALQHAKDIQQMVCLADVFLLKFFEQAKG